MKKYCFLLIGLLALTSCKKWLDITPQTDVSKDDLFKTEEGFEEALNGVYTRCAESDLYGYELTMGLPEVLAQNYTITSASDPYSYLQSVLYNYKDGNFISRKDAIWSGLYSGIVNANLILGSVDSKKSIFTGNNFAIIKGEALALRAYLHFDAFRLFGSAYFVGSVMTGIPYVTTYSNQVTAISSADEVLRQTLEDLNAAKQLLYTADSIRTPGYKIGYPYVNTGSVNNAADTATETSARSLFQQNRRHRLNYYAVCAELARVYLYEGDKVNALKNAEEVIASAKFPWTSANDFNNVDVKLIDRIMYKELIFGWYIPQQVSTLQGLYESGTAGFFINTTDADALYERGSVGGEDMRYKQWFTVGTTAGASQLLKYKRNQNAQTDDLSANLHPQMAPGIRKSEVYYIAAEASYDTDPVKALAYFNEVRFNRSIGEQLEVNSRDEFIKELEKEARKEFYAEGQIFYMYKRLNSNIPGPSGSVIASSKSIFVFPLPNDEIEFGGR